MYLNGVILVSPTGLGIDRDGPVRAGLRLPYFAAAAWYHNALPAESEMRRFSNLSLPLAILDYGDGGVTRYRLAVGEFDTIEAAQLAMQSASGQLPNGTWVRRIR